MRPGFARQKIIKQPVDPEQVRCMPKQFGALDRRLVYGKHICRMKAEQIGAL